MIDTLKMVKMIDEDCFLLDKKYNTDLFSRSMVMDVVITGDNEYYKFGSVNFAKDFKFAFFIPIQINDEENYGVKEKNTYELITDKETIKKIRDKVYGEDIREEDSEELKQEDG